MIADFYGERVALSVESWARDRATPSKPLLDAHIEFSNESLAWSPASARYKELQARLKLLQLSSISTVSELNELLDEGLALHRQAVKERPYWPLSWANIVYLKSLKKEYDQEFEQALIATLEYGPYESGALRRLGLAGIRGWGALSPDIEALVLTAFANSADIDARLSRIIRARLEDRALLETVCPRVNFHSEIGRKRLCG